jgi:hypothetical protein
MNVWTWLRLQWDRLAAGMCIAVGLLALLLGYIGVSGTVYPAEQLPYILSGGIFGVFALGLGAMLWLSADVRDEWRKLDVMEEKLDALDGLLRRRDRPLRARRSPAPGDGSVAGWRAQQGEPVGGLDMAVEEEPSSSEGHVLAAVSSGEKGRARGTSDGVAT